MFQYQYNRPQLAYIYNPKNQSREELIEGFVVRLNTFKKLFKEIKTAKMKYPEQHFLIEGKRGMGKTTLLLRLSYEIEKDSKLKSWLLPLVFNEEEYSIRKLYKLWVRIGELLAEKDLAFANLTEEMEQLSKAYKSDDDYEKALFEMLSKKLQETGKKIILFIDNFGDMFQKFKEKEAHRLRKILQTSSDIRIFAASSVVLEAFYDYSHPFYEFFKIIQLEGLNTKATRELLLKLGKHYQQHKIRNIVLNQHGRVESLRRLTGGVIRTILLLFEIFVDDQTGDAFRDLEAILDRVTPLYKHRMDDLPATQQEIVEAIALSWDAISVKEICERTRMESKVVSAQLNQLVKNEIISKIRTSTKNHLYQINERFFNIWYLMRHGRAGDKNKVLWLVRFLEEWCDERETIARAKKHMKSMKSGQFHHQAAYYMSEALAHSRHLPREDQHELLQVTRKYLDRKKSTYLNQLSSSDIELHKKGMQAFNQKHYLQALSYFLKMKEKDNFRIAYSYQKGKKDYPEAEQYYLKAAEKGSTNAMNNLALLYETAFNDYKKSEKYYLKAIERGNVYSLFNLALLYKLKLKKPDKAESFYLKAIEKGDKDAVFNLANLYLDELKNYEKASEYYLMAIEQGDLKAMSNLAYLQADIFNNYDEAEKYFKLALSDGLLYQPELVEIYQQNPVNFHLLFLLARKQFDFLYACFHSNEAEKLHLKDRLKPIYYTLMYFMQEKYPNEYLRMGEELKETVQEIIEEVKLLTQTVWKK